MDFVKPGYSRVLSKNRDQEFVEMVKAIRGLVFVALSVVAVAAVAAEELPAVEADDRPADWRLNLAKPKMMSFDRNEKIYWIMKTSKGEMKFELLPQVAPMHVTSTIYLTEQGFYDGLVFHRIIPKFMAQGGDPLGNGSGGPGYVYSGEFHPNVQHIRGGFLSMANRGPGTDGSQFFITFATTPWLDGKHTIFGEIVSGYPVLDAMERLGSRSGRTREKVFITTATIERVKN
jgi:peptidyl-prolyl cis-trans isomerase B (cyclophilin B)